MGDGAEDMLRMSHSARGGTFTSAKEMSIAVLNVTASTGL